MPRYLDEEKVKHTVNEYVDRTGIDTFTREDIFDFLFETDTADVQEVKRGKWIKHTVDIAEHPLHCSLCGWSNYRISNREVMDFGFCPNSSCGAKMDEEE